ncbi:MAG: hypothetical protein M0T86_07170 [Betaproteobacteria bacterium]|nr:hypothetical protein [Betaproteobacteria bacterium]
MYIILIAILYIWIMMIATSPTIGAALSLVLLGGPAIGLLYYILDTPGRKRRRASRQSGEGNGH